MPSLILVVFILQLIIHLISTFGGQTINDLVNATSREHVTRLANQTNRYGSSTPNYPRRRPSRQPQARICARKSCACTAK